MRSLVSERGVFWLIVLFLAVCGTGIASAQSTNTNTCVSPLSSEFYTKFEVVVDVEYVETNVMGPILNGSNAYEFEAAISMATNLDGTASNAMLTVPGEAPVRMSTNRALSVFSVLAATNAYTNLTSQFPDGTYEFSILGNSYNVALPDDTTLPNAPTLSDYTAYQNINPSKDFTLGWGSFVIGGEIDGISVTLENVTNGVTVYKSPDYDCPGQLTGTATSVVIPAGTLVTNSVYRTDITFVKVYYIDTNSIPGDAFLGGAEAHTRTMIATGAVSGTGPVSGAAPVLTNAVLLPGGGVSFNVSATPGLTYAVQFNQDLGDSSGWTALLTTNAVANVFSFTNLPGAGSAAGFYRAVQE
jgi:hypothetical protein